MPAKPETRATSTRCKPAGKDLRAAGISYLGSGIAFLAVAWLAQQPAFTGVGFAMVGLGLAWLLRGRSGR